MSHIPKRLSFLRIILYLLLIGIPVFALIAGLMLPRFLKLETYRPEIQAQLQRSSGRRMTIGALQAQFFPPSVMADKIVAFEQDPPHRPILSANQVFLRLSLRSLLKGKIDIYSVVIEQPRLILYTEGLTRVRGITPPADQPDRLFSLKVLVHDGRIELGGPLLGRTIQWGIDHVEGKVEGLQRRIVLSGRPAFLGPEAHLNVILDSKADIPAYLELKRANLDLLFSVLGTTQTPSWRGVKLDAHAEASWPVPKSLDVHIDRLAVPLFPKALLRGMVQISTASVGGSLWVEGLTSSMTVTGRWRPRWNGWDAAGRIDRYSPEIVRRLLKNRWADAMEGPGSLVISASKRGTRSTRFTLSGSSFTFSGSRLEIPSWTAAMAGEQIDISVNARTPNQDGVVGVRWTQPSFEESGKIRVTASSVPVSDVLDVLSVRRSTPIGVETWMIQEGRFEGVVDPESQITINDAALTFENLNVAATGQIDISTTPAQTRLVGTLSDVQLSPVLAGLGANPPPLTGVASAAFNIHFPAESRWMENFDGVIAAQSRDGFVHAGKVIYRIAGVLNLNNLLKPFERGKTTKAGFPYETVSGTAIVTRGVLDCRDFKIRTDNMNIGGAGHVNLPAKTIDAKLELQLLNVLKDTLSSIPLVKRVVSRDTGLIRIPVRIRGKLDNPEID